MLRAAGRTIARDSRRHARTHSSVRLYSSTSSSSASAFRRGTATTVAGTCIAATVLAVGAYAGTRQTVYNDAAVDVPVTSTPDEKKSGKVVSGTADALEDDGHLGTLVWGSNKSNLISPDDTTIDTFRSPCSVPWLRDVALRDVALHEQHGVCVDARGDVYQWGNAFFGGVTADGSKPEATLQGKDIVSVQATTSKVYALSSSGKVYALSVARSADRSDKPAKSSSWFGFGGGVQNCDITEIVPKLALRRWERFVSISAGSNHLLALTSLGRTYALPLSPNANAYGQLGFRRFDIPSSSPSSKHGREQVELTPKAIADPYASVTAAERALSVREPQVDDLKLVDSERAQGSITSVYCDQLHEVPSLRGIKVAQAVAGARSSFVRTEGEGRVLAWGANEFGQLGLGANVTVDTITVPTEVVFSRSASGGGRGHCVGIATGGDITFFLVERSNNGQMSSDLLACGMGQWGALGNGLYTTAQGTPTKVRAVSGLLEYSEATQSLQTITPHALSASPTGHVLLTLDTLSRAGPSGSTGDVPGRDLLVWGLNRDYQLGNGKRGSSATPGTIDVPISSSLPTSLIDGVNKNVAKTRRLMLRTRKADVKDMKGKVWKRGVQVEQRAVAGYGSSLVYWRVC